MSIVAGQGRVFAVLAVAAGLLVVGHGAAQARQAKSSPSFFQQLKMPWQDERRPQQRRQRRSAKPAPAKPAPRDAQPAKGRRGAPAKAVAAPGPEALPEVTGPPGLLPIARGPEIVDAWRALASQVPTPPDPPLLSPDGPAPAPANVVALVAPPPPAATPSLRPAPRAEAPEIRLPPERDEDEEPQASLPPATVPLPPLPPTEAKPEPTAPDLPLPDLAREDDPDCQALDAEGVAIVKPAPAIEGPGVCGSPAPVELSGVRRLDGGTITIKPAATVRCAVAREFAEYVRKDLAPAAERAGRTLERISIAGSYMCRGRNGAAGGKMSEHGRANAIDVSGLGFGDGHDFMIFDREMPQEVEKTAKSAACARFSTVLGPGSDGHHENHMHVDLQPRRSKTKLCQWDEAPVAHDEKDEETPAPARDDGHDAPDRAAPRKASQDKPAAASPTKKSETP